MLAVFAGTVSPRLDPAVQAQVETYIVEQYALGRSLRVLAEETGRGFSALRKTLNRRGTPRPVGARRLADEPPTL